MDQYFLLLILKYILLKWNWKWYRVSVTQALDVYLVHHFVPSG